MKRFSVREFAFLTLPVVLGAGCRASAPVAPKVEPPPKPRFSAQVPTTLQAFDGVKTVLVAQVGKDSRGEEYGFRTANPLFWVKVGDGKDAKLWRSDGAGSMAKGAFKPLVWGNASIDLPLKSIPLSPMVLGLETEVVSLDLYQPVRNFDIKGQWSVDKSQIEHFDFSLDKAPLTHPRAVVIYRRDAISMECDMEFVFDKAGEYERTPLEAQLREKHGRLQYFGVDSFVPPAPHNGRSVVFTIKSSRYDDLPIEITGRVSANNRWPLAFKIEPFVFKTAKVGQTLKFQSWPAPLPQQTRKN